MLLCLYAFCCLRTVHSAEHEDIRRDAEQLFLSVFYICIRAYNFKGLLSTKFTKKANSRLKILYDAVLFIDIQNMYINKKQLIVSGNS